MEYSSRIERSAPRLLSIFAYLTTLLIACLIFVGALVTSHDAGLSVPDWPTTYYQNMFTFPLSKWVGGILYEHGHRLFASAVGFLTLLFALMAWIYEPRRSVRVIAFVALGAVICQGILGGITVLFGLPDAVSISHALLGQTFLLIMLTATLSYSSILYPLPNIFHRVRASHSSRVASICVSLLYIQLFLGALVRHTGSGLALPDFPLMGGHIIPSLSQQLAEQVNIWRVEHALPPISLSNIIYQLLHRGGALIVVFGELYLAWSLLKAKQRTSVTLGIVIAFLVFSQFMLGALTIWSIRQPWITSLHVVTGALLLAATYTTVLLADPESSSTED